MARAIAKVKPTPYAAVGSDGLIRIFIKFYKFVLASPLENDFVVQIFTTVKGSVSGMQ